MGNSYDIVTLAVGGFDVDQVKDIISPGTSALTKAVSAVVVVSDGVTTVGTGVSFSHIITGTSSQSN